jgi:uncharacterized protein
MLRQAKEGVTVAVRAQPGAKRTALAGLYGEGAEAQLKIAVQAPPIEGRANEAIVAFLAKLFGRPKSSIEIISGELGRSKVFLVRGVALAEAEAIFSEQLKSFYASAASTSAGSGRTR